jgi:hypothetical protein
MTSSSLSRQTTCFAGLALVTTLALATLAALAPQAVGNKDGRFGNGDRGDNPVIGSLPCAAAPQMEWMFWEGLSNEESNTVSSGYLPVMAFTGNDLQTCVLNAAGEPYGQVNRYETWDAAGSSKACVFIVDRYAVIDGRISLWQWLPREYRGGEVAVSSPFGDVWDVPGEHAYKIPLSRISDLSGAATTSSVFTFTPSGAFSSLSDLKITVGMNGEVVVVRYQP